MLKVHTRTMLTKARIRILTQIESMVKVMTRIKPEWNYNILYFIETGNIIFVKLRVV